MVKNRILTPWHHLGGVTGRDQAIERWRKTFHHNNGRSPLLRLNRERAAILDNPDAFILRLDQRAISSRHERQSIRYKPRRKPVPPDRTRRGIPLHDPREAERRCDSSKAAVIAVFLRKRPAAVTVRFNASDDRGFREISAARCDSSMAPVITAFFRRSFAASTVRANAADTLGAFSVAPFRWDCSIAAVTSSFFCWRFTARALRANGVADVSFF